MLKIYFAGSIRGVRNGREQYLKIINHLTAFGTVLTEHVASSVKEIENMQTNLDDKGIHDRDLHWLKDCDLVIAECSVPSLGVGYEIGRAIEMKKEVIVLYNLSSSFKLSAMINGSNQCEIINYKNQEELFERLQKRLK